MKGRLKLWLFGAMSVIGLVLCVLFGCNVIHISYSAQAGLFLVGVLLLTVGAMYFLENVKKIKHPKEYERESIEKNDERNVSLKYKAGYRAGQILFVISGILLVLGQFFSLIPDSWLKVWPALCLVLWPVLQVILYIKFYND